MFDETFLSLLSNVLSDSSLVEPLWQSSLPFFTPSLEENVKEQVQKKLILAFQIPILKEKLATLSKRAQIKYLHHSVPFFLFSCINNSTNHSNRAALRKMLLSCLLSQLNALRNNKSTFFSLMQLELANQRHTSIEKALLDKTSFFSFINTILQEILTQILPISTEYVLDNTESFYLFFAIRIILLQCYQRLLITAKNNATITLVNKLFLPPLLLCFKREKYVYDSSCQLYNQIIRQLYKTKDSEPLVSLFLNIFISLHECFPLISTTWLKENTNLVQWQQQELTVLFKLPPLLQAYIFSAIQLSFGNEYFSQIVQGMPSSYHLNIKELLQNIEKLIDNTQDASLSKRFTILLNELKSLSSIFTQTPIKKSSRVSIAQVVVPAQRSKLPSAELYKYMNLHLPAFLDRAKLEGHVSNHSFPAYLYDFAVTSMPLIKTKASPNLIQNFFQTNLNWFKLISKKAQLSSKDAYPYFSTLYQNVGDIKEKGNHIINFIRNIGSSLQDLALAADVQNVQNNKITSSQELLHIKKNQILNMPLIHNIYDTATTKLTPISFLKLPLSNSPDPDIDSWHQQHFLYLQLLNKQQLLSDDVFKILRLFRNKLLKIKYEKYFSLFLDEKPLKIDEIILFIVFDLVQNNALDSIRISTL